MSMTSAQRILAAERRQKALELRKRGMLLKEIAAELGVHTASARRIISDAMKAMAEAGSESFADMRDQELADLHLLEEELMDKFFAREPQNRLEILDRILKIKERRAKLTGIDAPTKTETKSLTFGIDLNNATTPELIGLARKLGVTIPAGLLEVYDGSTEEGAVRCLESTDNPSVETSEELAGGCPD